HIAAGPSRRSFAGCLESATEGGSMKKSMYLPPAAAVVLLCPAGAFASNAASEAAADAAAESGPGELTEIVVTARRREESASKVPIAISAFSGEQLVAKGVRATDDLGNIAPGLTIVDGGAPIDATITMRGQSKAVSGNGSPGVIVYQNDVPLSN